MGRFFLFLFLIGFVLKGLSAKSPDELTYLMRCGSYEMAKDAFSSNQGSEDLNTKDSHGMTPLLEAADSGRGDLVLFMFLTLGANLLETDPQKNTVLHVATIRGNLGVIQVVVNALQQKRSDLLKQLIDSRNDELLTVLHLAAKYGHADIVSFLLQEGCDPNVLDGNDKSPFYWAVKNGKESVARVLMASPKFDINRSSPWGMTALHEAAKNGNLPVVEGLIKAGAKIDCRDVDGRTPLYWACERGCADVVVFLLEQGANPLIKDDDQRTVLHRAARYGHTTVAQILLKNGKLDVNIEDPLGDTPLCWAVRNGHLDTVEFLIKAGADMRVLTRSGTDILQETALRGHGDMVKFLVSRGIKVDREDAEGRTALQYVSMVGETRMASLLMALGANPQHKDRQGKTPFNVAVSNGTGAVTQNMLKDKMDVSNPQDLEILQTNLVEACHTKNIQTMEVLLNHYRDNRDMLRKLINSDGVTLDISDDSGLTVFDYALKRRHIKLLTLLLLVVQNGPAVLDALKVKRSDFNTLDEKDGMAMLHYAALMGESGLADFLLKGGANPNEQEDDSGKVPLHEAVSSGNSDVVDVLLKGKASYNAVDQRGQTPFVQAIKSNFGAAVALFLQAGADPQAFVGNTTPFQMTIESKNTQMLELFMNQVKADNRALDIFDRKETQNLQDSNGMSIGHWIAKNGHSGLLDVVLNLSKMLNHPDFSMIDNSGRTALHYAAVGGFTDIVRTLLQLPNSGLDINTPANDRSSAVDEAAMGGFDQTVIALLALGGRPNVLDTKGDAEKILNQKNLDPSKKAAVLNALFPPPPPIKGKK